MNYTEVELVGGPHCGLVVRWPDDVLTRLVENRGTVATYVRESQTKALWAAMPAAKEGV